MNDDGMQPNTFQLSEIAADYECLLLVEKDSCDNVKCDTFSLPDKNTYNNCSEMARDGGFNSSGNSDSHQVTEDEDNCSQAFTVDFGRDKTDCSLQTAFLEFRRKKQVRVDVFHFNLGTCKRLNVLTYSLHIELCKLVLLNLYARVCLPVRL
jgi:hypothetical protein